MPAKENKAGSTTKPKQNNMQQGKGQGNRRNRRRNQGRKGPMTVPAKNLPLRLETRKQLVVPGPNVADMRNLSRAITLPGESRPMRFPYMAAGLQRTALAALRETITMNWTDHPAENQVAMLTYSPVCPVWTYRTIGEVRYRHQLSSTFTGAGDTIVPGNSDIYSDDDNYVPWMAHPTTNSWFAYVPSGHGFNLIVSDYVSGAGPSTCEVEIITIAHGGHTTAPHQIIVPLQDNIVTGSNHQSIHPVAATAFTKTHWLAISSVRFTGTAKVDTKTGTVPRVTIQVPSSTALHPIVFCPDSKLLPFMRQARVNAASLVVSNTSPEYYKNGTVVGGLLTSTEVDPFDIEAVKQALESLNRESRYDGPAKDGIYTYLPPANPSALTFTDYAPPLQKFKLDGTSPVQAALLNYGDFERVNYIRFTVDTTNSFTLKLRYDVHLEFVTRSQLFQVVGSRLDKKIFEDAMQASADLRPFTENPLHVAEFAALAKMLFNKLMPYAAPHLRQGVKGLAHAADQWLAQY